jgi:hypothetical protein
MITHVSIAVPLRFRKQALRLFSLNFVASQQLYNNSVSVNGVNGLRLITKLLHAITALIPY